MLTVEITTSGTVELRDVPPPEAGPGEVVVEVALTGICGTDLHIVDGHFPTARYPAVPGHEATGRVVGLGAGVRHVAVGDRVVLDPGLPCGVCVPCRRGRLNLCEHREAVGISRPGAAAELVVVPGRNCHRIPDGVPDDVAVLTEPTACVVHAFDLVPRPDGLSVLVYGAGTVGTLAAQVARRLGAHSVTVVDPNRSRLERLAGRADVGAPTADEAPSGPAWDLVVDATGAVPAIQDGLSRVARGGTFLQVGVAPPGATVPLVPYDVFARELLIRGSMTTQSSFPRAIALLASGALDVAGVVSSVHPLRDYETAVEVARVGEHLKVAVDPRR